MKPQLFFLPLSTNNMRLLIVLIFLTTHLYCCAQILIENATGQFEITVISTESKTVEINKYLPSNTDDGKLIIPRSLSVNNKSYKVISLGDSIFYGNTNIKKVYLPRSICHVGSRAFAECNNLQEIIVGNQLVLYDFEALNGTAWLDHQQDGIVYLGTTVYKYKGVLPRHIKIKRGTKAICDHAFSSSKESKIINNITLPGSLRYLSGFDFTSIDNIIIPPRVKTIGIDAFFSCTHLKKVVFPKKLKKICYGAFSECYSLENIVLPQSLKYIDDWAFHNCINNKEIIIPDAVETIGDYSFSNSDGLWYVYNDSSITHSKLKHIQIGKGLKELPDHAFSLNSIDSITIPANVKIIRNAAFETPGTLFKVRCESIRPPFIDITSNPFGFNMVPYIVPNKERILYIPHGSLKAYMNAEGWGDFDEIIEFDQ
jgi:hypothetical protein